VRLCLSPGTVIISAVAEVDDIRKTISPALQPIIGSQLIYIDFSEDTFKLGGSSFAQVVNQLGTEAPTITDEAYFVKSFEAVQKLIKQNQILSGHDISSGGLITTLLEMCFPVPAVGLSISTKDLGDDLIKTLFSENPGIVIQVSDVESPLRYRWIIKELTTRVIAEVNASRRVVNCQLPITN
jgi:phosphoribosylformylglycinamidine synthase